jgi:hypothetical protein
MPFLDYIEVVRFLDDMKSELHEIQGPLALILGGLIVVVALYALHR